MDTAGISAVGYVGAFLGGALTLASPCGALLLPAFFAYAFPRPVRLLGRTAVFYVGLAAALVPLGVGSAQASRLVYGHQAAFTTGVGLLLATLGVVQLCRGIGRPRDAVEHPGGGSSRSAGLARLARGGVMDGPRGVLLRLRDRLGSDSVPAVLVLGAVAGLGGFCSGPILGGVLTLAAASGTSLRGAALLAVFAAGMVAPLVVLAALWERYDLGRRRWLRTGVAFGGFRVAVAPALSGVILCALGALFLYYRGSAGLTGLFQPAALAAWEGRAQAWVGGVQEYVPDLAVLAALAAVVLVVAAWRLRNTR